MASKKETAAEAAAARAEVEKLTRMNIDDTFMAIVNKKAGITNEPSAGRNSFVDRDNSYVAGKKVENQHMDWDEMLHRLGKTPQQRGGGHGGRAAYAGGGQNTISIALQNRVMESFTPIVNELSRFKFASAPDKRDKQMTTLVAAVREAMQKVAIKEVAANTKRYYPNAARFVQTDTGMQVYYKVANVNVLVSAHGEFFGDEIVCLEQEGTNVTAHVAREGSDGFEDLTGNYDIKLELS